MEKQTKEVPQWLKDGAYTVYTNTVGKEAEKDQKRDTKKKTKQFLFFYIAGILISLCIVIFYGYKNLTLTIIWVITNMVILPLIAFIWSRRLIHNQDTKVAEIREIVSNSVEYQEKYLVGLITECDEYETRRAPFEIVEARFGFRSRITSVNHRIEAMQQKKKDAESWLLKLS